MLVPDLARWLTTLDGPQLERVLGLRSEVLLGAPAHDLPDLADRLAHPASVAAVVRELPTPALQVLETLAATGAGASPDRVAEVLDPGAHDPYQHARLIAGTLDHLADCALAWPDGTGRVRVNPGVLQVLDVPLGVGVPGALLVPHVNAQTLQKVVRRWGLDVPKRKAELVDAVLEQLGDAPSIRRLVGQAPAQVTATILDQARQAARRMTAPEDHDEDEDLILPFHLRDQQTFARHRVAAAWAVENGLAYGHSYDTLHAQIPSEVVLALADAEHRAPFSPEQPHLPTGPVAREQVDGAASSAVTEAVGTVMATLEHLARTPLTLRKAGGVGTRELTRVAKALGTTATDVRLALELAHHLDLLGPVGPGRLGTGDRFAPWRALAPARRAADLLNAWVGTPYVPTVDRDPDGASLPALSRWATGDSAVMARATLLSLLHDLPDDAGVTSVDALVDAVTWRSPVVLGTTHPDPVRPTVTEAERLGLVALGRLSPVGERLVATWDTAELVDPLAAMLPAVQDRAVIGSDLTVMVLGSPAPRVVDLLDAVAAREARGQASTWRLTPASVRGAFDAGYAPDDVLAGLRKVAGGDLPQAVEYLVQDVARRHGHVHVRPAAAVVVGQDAALVAEIAAHRALRRFGLHAVAPTVLVASAPVAEVLTGLRGAGYLPVETDGGGTPVVSVQRVTVLDDEVDVTDHGPVPPEGAPVQGEDDADAALARWAAQMAGVDLPVTGEPPAEESPADAAARLLRGEAPARTDEVAPLVAEVAGHAQRLTRVEVDQLAHAVVHRLPVRLRYQSRSGNVSVRVVSDLALLDGYLLGWCHLRDESRTFALGSLLGVIAEPG